MVHIQGWSLVQVLPLISYIPEQFLVSNWPLCIFFYAWLIQVGDSWPSLWMVSFLGVENMAFCVSYVRWGSAKPTGGLVYWPYEDIYPEIRIWFDAFHLNPCCPEKVTGLLCNSVSSSGKWG